MKREKDINNQNTTAHSRLVESIFGVQYITFPKMDGCKPECDIEKQRRLQNQLIEILGTLTDREQQVMTSIYGLDGKKKSYKEIAADMGITQDEVCEMEAISLRKMRHPSRSRSSKNSSQS